MFENAPLMRSSVGVTKLTCKAGKIEERRVKYADSKHPSQPNEDHHPEAPG